MIVQGSADYAGARDLSDMYRPFNAEDDLIQGDICEHVTFAYINNLATPELYNAAGEPAEIESQTPIGVEDRIGVLEQAEKSRMIVLSQDCDILSKPFICVDRIYDLASADAPYVGKNSPKARAEHIQRNYQRPGVQPPWFYLQESAPHQFQKSLVSFMELHSIKATEENIQYLRQNRILRLAQEAIFDLQFRFGLFFGRFATTDDYMLTEEERGLVRH